MSYPHSLPLSALCVSLLLSGCTAEPVSSLCGGSIVAGDLAISEIFPNPDGGDGDGFGEYVELYNASSAPIDLEGLRLVASRLDGDDAKGHVIGKLSIEPGQYLVLVNAPADEMPVFANYTYGASLGALRNSNGRIALGCGSETIDEAVYETSADGKAIELDGASPPDSVRNDDMTSWCEAIHEITSMAGNYGTPGAPNMTCGATVGASNCVDQDGSRPVAKPAVGDVTIAEWMPNPKGADGDLEWIELKANKDFDLNALQLGTAAESLKNLVSGDDCVPVSAGSYVVIGKSEEAAPTVIAVSSFSLANSGERAIFIASGGTVLDQVSYTTTVEGVSWHVDSGGVPCISTSALQPPSEYSTGNFGTPGAANAQCVPEGQCTDPVTRQLRAIRKPTAGQISITEWLSDAAGADEGKEWIELFASAAIDLNGLQVGGDELEDKIGSLECLPVAARTYVVVGQSPASAPVVNAIADFSLGNSGVNSVVVGVDDTVLDEVLYDGSTSAVSRQIDGSGVACASSATEVPPGQYDGENQGSPGAANPACGPTIGTGQCFDTGSQTSRTIVSPTANAVQITEWLANPAGTDTQKEWFEVRFATSVDLNGVVLSDTSATSTTLASDDCLEVPAGSHIVFAKNANSIDNGGIANIFATFAFALNNSGTETIRVSHDGDVLSEVTFNSRADGAATQIDSSGATCTATTPYGDGSNRGTPGSANPVCP